MSIEEAITTIPTTTRAIATTIALPTAMPTLATVHSNIILDYIFQGIYTIKILVLKRFIPSVKGKKEPVKHVLVENLEYTCFTK